MAVIEISKLTKYYGKICGVKSVSFSVEQGEIFGFLGPNGAGKTTTIRLMMNLLRRDSGELELLGTPVKPNSFEVREKIGYLPGDFSPYREMSGIQFLKYITKYRSRPPIWRAKLFQQLQLAEQDISQKIKYLSHGTRQKLGIVMAFEHDPELAILDEPTIGLDPIIQESFYEFVLAVQQRGNTVFLSSHILPEVEKVCQRVAIIRKGEIVVMESINNLKAKRPRRMTIEFDNELAANPLKLSGVTLLNQEGNRFTFLIESEIPRLLKKVSKLPIKDIIFPEPNLEDIFLGFYATTGNGQMRGKEKE